MFRYFLRFLPVENNNGGADRYERKYFFYIFIVHAYTAGGGSGVDCPGIECAVNAMALIGKSHPACTKPRMRLWIFFVNLKFTERSRCFGPADSNGIGFVQLILTVKISFSLSG